MARMAEERATQGAISGVDEAVMVRDAALTKAAQSETPISGRFKPSAERAQQAGQMATKEMLPDQ